uniref:L1 transposable element RRM domain-containing protein n=1 Tax=Cacopsylla melanoneura TaxID=428564 RepID=A0A8D8Y720_9HEMI
MPDTDNNTTQDGEASSQTKLKAENNRKGKPPASKKGKDIKDEDLQEFEEEEDELGKKIEKVMKKLLTNHKTQIMKEMKKELTEVHRLVEFASGKLDEVSEIMKVITVKQTALEKENQELKLQLTMVTDELEDMQQYSRRRIIQIDGIPKQDNENLEEIMKQIGIKLGVSVDNDQIDAIHRIPTRSQNPEPIVVEFTTRKVRNSVINNSKTKRIRTKDLGLGTADRPVYIYEQLSPRRKKLLYEAKKLKQEKQYKYVWTREGKIFMRKEDTSNPIRLQSLDDLKKIV